MFQRGILLSALLAAARAQQAGTQTQETKPSLTWQKCTANGCTDQKGSVGIDANWRWVHSTDGSTNCYTGNTVRFDPWLHVKKRLTDNAFFPTVELRSLP